MNGLVELPWLELFGKSTLLLLIAHALHWVLIRRWPVACGTMWNCLYLGLLVLIGGMAVVPRYALWPERTVPRTLNDIGMPFPSPMPIPLESFDPSRPRVPWASSITADTGHGENFLNIGAAKTQSIAIKNVAAWVFISGTVVCLVRWWLSIAAVHRLLRGAGTVTDSTWQAALARWRDRLALRGPIALKESADVDVPILAGLIPPTIVIPDQLICLDRDGKYRDAVLVHELAHVQRADYAWQLFQGVVGCFYWYHPLVWFARRAASDARERACDSYAVFMLGDRVRYSATLLELASRLTTRSSTYLGMAMTRTPRIAKRLAALASNSGIPVCQSTWPCFMSCLSLAMLASLSVAALELSDAGHGVNSPVAISAGTPAPDAAVPSAKNTLVKASATRHELSIVDGTVSFWASSDTSKKPAATIKNALTVKVTDDQDRPISEVQISVYKLKLATGECPLFRSAVTQADGAARCTGLFADDELATFERHADEFPPPASDPLCLVVRRSGWSTVMNTLPLARSIALHGHEVGFQLRSAVQLDGQVLDTNGNPIRGAEVRAGGDFRIPHVNTVATDQNGHFQLSGLVAYHLPPDKVSKPVANGFYVKNDLDAEESRRSVITAQQMTPLDLTVTHPDYASAIVRPMKVPSTISVRMRPAAKITGRVVQFGTNQPAAGVLVMGSTQLRLSVHPELTDQSKMQVGVSAQTVTDANGQYELAGLAPGVYSVAPISLSSRWDETERVGRGVSGLQLTEGATESANLTVGRGGTVVGRLVDARTGKPLPSLSGDPIVHPMQILPTSEGGSRSLFQQVPLRGDGTFVMRAVPGKSAITVRVCMAGQPTDNLDFASPMLEDFSRFPIHIHHDETINIDVPVFPQAVLLEVANKRSESYTLLREKQWESAIEQFGKVLEIDPTSRSARTGRAHAYEALGKFVEGIADYEEALKGHPDDLNVQMGLARLLAMAPLDSARNGRRARELAQAVVKASRQLSNPEFTARTLDILAAAHAELGEFDQAIAAQTESIELAADESKDVLRSRLELYRSGRPRRLP